MSGLLAALALSSFSAAAQGIRDCGSTAIGTYQWLASGQVSKANNCQGGSGFRCHPVEGTGSSVEKINPACDPTAGSCAVKIHATATIPGLGEARKNPESTCPTICSQHRPKGLPAKY